MIKIKKILFKLFFYFIIYLGVDLNAEKIVVTIDNIVKIIDEQSSQCIFRDWENKLENTCLCCIIKNAQKILSLKSNKNAQKIIKACVNNKSCNADIIDNLMPENMKINYKNLKNKDEVYRNFIKYIFDKSVVVKSIDSSINFFNNSGNFRDAVSVEKFLEMAYKEGKLNNKAFESVSCIEAREMVEEKRGATFGTAQLFLINSKCGNNERFILKEIRPSANYNPADEIYRLSRSNKYADLKDFIYPNSVEKYPQIILPIAYFSYTYKNKKHYLVLMNTASGFVLNSLIDKFRAKRNDQNTNRLIAQAYYDIGVSMANFYKKFMIQKEFGKLGKTIIHGDFHHKNIFYNPQDGKVTFIDNERLSNSIDVQNRKDISQDLDYLLMMSINITRAYDNNFFNGFDLDAWLYMTLSNFVFGFLSTYNKDEIKKIIVELKNRIVNKEKYSTGPNLYNEIKKFSELKNKNLVEDFFKDLENKPQSELEKLVYKVSEIEFDLKNDLALLNFNLSSLKNIMTRRV